MSHGNAGDAEVLPQFFLGQAGGFACLPDPASDLFISIHRALRTLR
jgi:hypothetical protein